MALFPRHITNGVASYQFTSHRSKSCHSASRYVKITTHRIKLQRIVSHRITLHHITSHQIASHHIASHQSHIASHHVVFYHITPLQSAVVIIQMFLQICLVITQDTRIVVDALLHIQQQQTVNWQYYTKLEHSFCLQNCFSRRDHKDYKQIACKTLLIWSCTNMSY